MAHNSGSAGYSPLGRWRWIAPGRRGFKMLAALRADEYASIFYRAHEITEALRKLGESLRNATQGQVHAQAQFEYESETGKISLKIFDPETGELQVQLTPEEVARGLQSLEETSHPVSPLSAFFVDVTI